MKAIDRYSVMKRPAEAFPPIDFIQEEIMTRTGYTAFLERKHHVVARAGRDVALEDIHPMLFPFQAQLVQWATRKGRSAIFADCGLGKTLMQLEWMRLVDEPCLIVCPLAVARQTIREAKRIGIDLKYARSQEDAAKFTITNYEMVGKFDPSQFGSVVLDESSILKSFDGKTRSRLIEMFSETPYRLCCTATPAPNDLSEFANHAEFLGICTREEMLSLFFVHDENGWRLKGHAQNAFYRWLASWAMMVKTPSDIGFEDDGFILPKLDAKPVWIEGDALEFAQANGMLFPMGLGGIQGRSQVRRMTIEDKVDRAASIINGHHEQWLVWCGLNDEGRQLKQRIPDAVLIEGSDTIERKEAAIESFVAGLTKVLISKPSIFGFGVNLQNCHNVLFLGLNDSYETWYQAVRRCWRFGQKNPVNVRVVLSDLESAIWENVMSKEQTAEKTSREMIKNVAQYEIEELGLGMTQRSEYQIDDRHGESWHMMRGDCVERLAELKSESIDLSVFSPPFLDLYVYSDSERDIGNSRTEVEFYEHFGYMLDGLVRVLKPGRIVVCHVAQVPAKLIVDGYIGLKDFRGMIISAFLDKGFVYHGDITIDKNPQAQAVRTHSKGLLFAQLHKDASWLRPGLADYLLVFRKPGDNAVPIKPDISNDDWIEWAHPVWYGMRESDTLHVAEGRAEPDERHVAPLQLGVIRRCVKLWSNPGEKVLSPFAGIGSEGYQSLLEDRRFVGIELKDSYFEAACRNLEAATMKRHQLLLPIMDEVAK